MKTQWMLILLLLVCNILPAQQQAHYTQYSFILQDSPAQQFTMRQVNQSYLSGYRLFSRGLHSAFTNQDHAQWIEIALEGLFLMPLTHEEGHRSILTGQNIGSISQPYFNSQGAAYVKGVTDQTLQQLRDENLPVYIRLHSGGLESDYMLAKRMEQLGSFNQDELKYFQWDYLFRKVSILQYYVTGLFSFEINLKEEKDELERDIVGYDTYGAARHLYRPHMKFHRYTRYDELTSQEKHFVQRMGYRSLLNLLNPMVIGIPHFKLGENTQINAGMGYTMSPFGDFIDENIWFKYRDINLAFYARQYQNHNTWFPAFGLSLVNYPLSPRFMINIAGHYWQQPHDFDFHTTQSFTGGALDGEVKYFIPFVTGKLFKGFSIDAGIQYKTRGFLPETLPLGEDFGFRLGTSLAI